MRWAREAAAGSVSSLDACALTPAVTPEPPSAPPRSPWLGVSDAVGFRCGGWQSGLVTPRRGEPGKRWQRREEGSEGRLLCASRVSAACLRWPAPCCRPEWRMLHRHGGIGPLQSPHPAAGASPGDPAPACRRGRGTSGSTHARKLEVKCLKVRSLFSMNLLYLILSTNSNLIASGLKPLQ